MKKIIGVIPARYKSSRFPGKPLADIEGRPMVWWVYQNVTKVTDLNKVYVATDDDRIKNECIKYDIPVLMTRASHPTGTDRVAEVAQQIKADIYINIQGDEPLVEPETIKKAIEPFKKDSKNISVTNLMTQIKRESDIGNVTIPKVAINFENHAIFLSRLPIPYPKRGEKQKYYKQVCVYGFTPVALQAFSQLARGPAETAEDIELLRFIENHILVQMVVVQQDTVAVDTQEDLELVRKIIRERKRGEKII